MQIEDAEGILIFDDRAQEESLDRRERPDVLALRPLPAVARSRAPTCSMRSTTATGARYRWRSSWRSNPTRTAIRETRKIKRRREMVEACIDNALRFRFVLMDSWFSSQKKFEHITGKTKHLIAALKGNRLVVLSEDDRRNKRLVVLSQ